MSITINQIEPFVFRSPLETPRRNAFGIARERQVLLVRVVDGEGREGWGESFSNWPSFGVEYRAHYISEIIAPALKGFAFEDPPEVFERASNRLRPLRQQTADFGAINQAIAAIDIAVWDLFAKHREQPLWRALGGTSAQPVPVYASALTGDNFDKFLQPALAKGMKSFKLKVGFGRETDVEALTELRRQTGADARLMVDANQIWTPQEAVDNIAALADVTDLFWVEEPISALADPDIWATLAQQSPVDLAAGENLYGLDALRPFLANKAVTYFQPDIIKWGGLSGVREVGKKILANGSSWCPHYLGGGLGLAATAHLIAAMDAPTMLEFDVSENPFREMLFEADRYLKDGAIRPGDAPGHGVVPDLQALAQFR